MHRRPAVSRRCDLALLALSFACARSPAPDASTAPGTTQPSFTRAALVRQYDPAYPRVAATVEPLEPDVDERDADRAALTAALARALGEIGNLVTTDRHARRRVARGLAGPYAIGGRSRVVVGPTTAVALELYIRSLRDGLIVATVTVRGTANADDTTDAAELVRRARAAAFAALPVAVWDRFQQIL